MPTMTDTLPMTPLLRAVAVDKAYRTGPTPVPVLRGVDLSVTAGEFAAVVGQSGSGKSTLMHLLGLLDAPDGGSVELDGERVDNLPARQRDRLRNTVFGFVFQFYHLLPELTLEENVLSPLMIRDGVIGYLRGRRGYRAEAAGLLERVGLSHRAKHRPRELSGGEMQRAAIARALITKPRLLLADEPTGNLDSRSAGDVFELLRGLNGEDGLSVLMVTHDDALAARADRTIRLVEGRCQDARAAA